MSIKLKELGDLGDRMALGMPYAQGGAVTGTNNLSKFNSPETTSHIEKYKGDQSSVDDPVSPYDSKDPWEYVKDVEKIKNKVTPDEIIQGIEYEISKMVVANKSLAKQIVVNNLKKDPVYYSKLHMMGVNVDERHEAMMEIMTSLKARKYAKQNGDYYV